jgi:PPK2 family polyphosphate:nucleotide phosphotransferase
MKKTKVMNKAERRRSDDMIARYRVRPGKKFRLSRVDPADTAGVSLESKEAKDMLRRGVGMLADLQGKLYAQDHWGVLIVLQAMDAAGKDGTIKHVMSGINPQGVQVNSFKSPSSEELDHDFLWRSMKVVPERGRIGIFNRSYYEEVLVVRVHPEFLLSQKLPPRLVTRRIWDERYEDINAFERYLSRNGILVLKFFLCVSKGEQKRRFLERLDMPDKNWKFSMADAKERGFWDDYMTAYEDAIEATSTEWAPWHVVPADNKWFTRIVVALTIIRALEGLDLNYPKVGKAKRKELAAVRKALV